PFAVSNRALEVRIEAANVRSLMLRATITADSGQIEALLAQAAAAAERADQGLDFVGEWFLGDPALVDEARRELDDWAVVRGRVAALARAGQTEQAAALARTEGTAFYEPVTATLDRIIAFARGKASSFVERIIARAERHLTLAMGGVVAGLALCVLVAWVVARGITRPLRALRLGMLEIAAGRLNQPIPDLERRDEIGEMARALRTLRDHVAARVAADERSSLLSEALGQSPSMVMVTDAEGTILYVNRRFTELSGYLPEEAIGRTPRLLKWEGTPSETHDRLWRAITEGHEWRSEIEDRRKNGQPFWAMATVAPIRDRDGVITHFISTHEDITERKLAEAALENARDSAEIANRAKSDLLANMSHELRTPLNAIIGFSSAMRGELFGPVADRYKEYLGDIQSSGEHLLELIEDILDVSAIEAGKLTLRIDAIDLQRIVGEAVKLVSNRAEAGGVALLIDMAEAPPLAADARRVKQIILNLLTNAVKFTPEGGRVTLSVRSAAGGVEIVVEDTGIGMDEQGLALALSPFGQIDSAYARRNHGTGLGLPLTRGLAEAHGGRLEISSAPGRGTRVRIHLPSEAEHPLHSILSTRHGRT
ncbi:MAG: PAS domain S-box protein, partial [Alphaproteobacteria bacterium]|nr:PAS domain S-box protein [Alphaproteobacteria bacterium]